MVSLKASVYEKNVLNPDYHIDGNGGGGNRRRRRNPDAAASLYSTYCLILSLVWTVC